MDHAAHALLELPAAISLIAGGLIVLALAWRRAVRGEPSGVVISHAARETALSIAVIPAIGLSAAILIVLGAALVNGQLRLP